MLAEMRDRAGHSHGRLDAPSAVAIARVIARHIMKGPRIQAVEMSRKIRDRHARRLAGKTPRKAPPPRQLTT